MDIQTASQAKHLESEKKLILMIKKLTDYLCEELKSVSNPAFNGVSSIPYFVFPLPEQILDVILRTTSP